MIKLPYFRGFLQYFIFRSETLYEIVHSNEDYYRELYGESVDLDKLEIDDNRYIKDVCVKFINLFQKSFDKNYPGFIQSMEYRKLVSPPYYQCNTDKLFVNACLCEKWKGKMIKFMLLHREWLTAKINKDWSDRPGFKSYMSNEYDVWLEEIMHQDCDLRIVDAMLGYMGEKANPKFKKYLDGAFRNTDISDYIVLQE